MRWPRIRYCQQSYIIPKDSRALIAAFLIWETFSAHGAGAFVNLSPYEHRSHFGRSCTVLRGKGWIQRGGQGDDSDILPIQLEEGEEESQQSEIEVPSMSLQELLLPSMDCDVNQIGPTALAYIGDNVFELMVRARHVWPTRRTADLQQQVVSVVRAEHQARLLAMLYTSSTFSLSKKEEQILARGRNSASSGRPRKNAVAYQGATAFEALIGFLYISDRTRCEELLNWIYAHLDRVEYDESY